MNITILDDYQDAVRTLDAFKKVEGHHVGVRLHPRQRQVTCARISDT